MNSSDELTLSATGTPISAITIKCTAVLRDDINLMNKGGYDFARAAIRLKGSRSLREAKWSVYISNFVLKTNKALRKLRKHDFIEITGYLNFGSYQKGSETMNYTEITASSIIIKKNLEQILKESKKDDKEEKFNYEEIEDYDDGFEELEEDNQK